MNARTDLNEFISHYEKKIVEYRNLEKFHEESATKTGAKIGAGFAETYRLLKEESEILLGYLIELKDRREQDNDEI